MSKKKKSKEVVETTDEISTEDQVDVTIDTTEETVEALNGETFTEEDTSSEKIQSQVDEEVNSDTSEDIISQDDVEGEKVEGLISNEIEDETLDNEPLVFSNEPVGVSAPEYKKVSNDENLSVMLNGYPVAKSFILDQMANNPTIRILEVRPNAYISVKTGSK